MFSAEGSKNQKKTITDIDGITTASCLSASGAILGEINQFVNLVINRFQKIKYVVVIKYHMRRNLTLLVGNITRVGSSTTKNAKSEIVAAAWMANGSLGDYHVNFDQSKKLFLDKPVVKRSGLDIHEAIRQSITRRAKSASLILGQRRMAAEPFLLKVSYPHIANV